MYVEELCVAVRPAESRRHLRAACFYAHDDLALVDIDEFALRSRWRPGTCALLRIFFPDVLFVNLFLGAAILHLRSSTIPPDQLPHYGLSQASTQIRPSGMEGALSCRKWHDASKNSFLRGQDKRGLPLHSWLLQQQEQSCGTEATSRGKSSRSCH